MMTIKMIARVLLALILGAAGTLGAQDAALRAGDQIEIRIGGVPSEDISQITGIYTVDGDGYINMPHIGKVHAAGATQSQLQGSIESAYKSQQIYTNPSITLAVPNAARFVEVSGDVRAPQRVPFTADLTVLGAITGAGGFTEYADQSKVSLTSEGKVFLVNVKDVRKNPAKDIKVKPGDKVYVPQSFW
ncbi:MAG: polysaccharide biosynthesis/export family protein [Verrucomicrobiae bacterium]